MFGVDIMKRPIFNFKMYFNIFKQTLQIKHLILLYHYFFVSTKVIHSLPVHSNCELNKIPTDYFSYANIETFLTN